MVERWMDWLLGALNTPYVAVFRDAKKAPAERAPDFAAQSADLLAQLKILDGPSPGAIGSRSIVSPSPTLRSARS
jgi:glutathione S-transferase